MGYKLRFVQKFQQSGQEEFMELERMFMKLEATLDEFPKGKRYVSYIGREPTNTLIWECEFSTLEEAIGAKVFLENDNRHEALFQKQVMFFVDSYVEIYKSVEP